MNTIYKVGETVRLTRNCRNKYAVFLKGEELVVEDVNETTLYLFNGKGELTIHRLLSELIEKL
jgi:hypothetical protein